MSEEQIKAPPEAPPEAPPLRNRGAKRDAISASAPAPSEEISPFRNQPTPSPTLNPTDRTSTEPNISFIDKHGQVIIMGGLLAGGLGMGRLLYKMDRSVQRQIGRELMEERMTGASFHPRGEESARMRQENAARFSQETAQTPQPAATVV